MVVILQHQHSSNYREANNDHGSGKVLSWVKMMRSNSESTHKVASDSEAYRSKMISQRFSFKRKKGKWNREKSQ